MKPAGTCTVLLSKTSSNLSKMLKTFQNKSRVNKEVTLALNKIK